MGLHNENAQRLNKKDGQNCNAGRENIADSL